LIREREQKRREVFVLFLVKNWEKKSTKKHAIKKKKKKKKKYGKPLSI